MSIPLLRDPDRLHDLVDDLESLFWVLVYGALKRFVRGDPRYSMRMFDGETRDEMGRLVGGVQKYSALWSGAFLRQEYVCPSLQRLIHVCAARWNEYQLLKRSAPELDEDTVARLKSILDLACQPSFWMEKFVTALEQVKSCCSHHESSSQLSSGTNLAVPVDEDRVKDGRRGECAGRKRQLLSEEDDDDKDARHIPLRRSKRIKRL